MNCGTPLTAPPAAEPATAPAATPPPAAPAAPDIERKVITALFCDVVGSTELAERLDPEDVDRLLRAYHSMARKRIEAHGGTLEKFIGDAVLGVFGAPAAHEDDPDRAIRASLRILEGLADSDLELHVRIGIHTGEAVVRVGQDRTAEEGLATGDTLNTAARLQNVAVVDGIAVSDSTRRRTTGAYDWADMGEISVKGKAQPIHVWQPVAESAFQSAAQADEATPFLGRDDELAALVAAFDRAANGRSLELVTIIAEAGMGKSRLVRELRREVEARSPGAVWRKGRCLPYGDGVSFWALGEIVKTHAEILETDDQAAILKKLDAVLTEPDAAVRTWLRDRLAPLVGLQTSSAPGTRQETFSAWQRFLQSLAADAPAVIVIEDLHWADEDLAAFLIDLADNAEGLPLDVVVTARPDVAGRHPGWLNRARQATLVQLTSLGDTAIEALVASTLSGASPELVQLVLERAAGSPLYAEQLVALLRERALSTTDGTIDASVIPPTIQALLSARIDALPRQLKPALLDASVIGRVFWTGAVAALTGEPAVQIEDTLADLAHRELTRPISTSTMVGEAEYSFWHALLRDVAYSFLPRSARLAKHRAAAAWITAELGGSLGDVAEIVVDHLRRALELAEATGADEELPAIRADLATTLLAAADHAMRVGPTRAVPQLKHALQLLSDDDPRRGDVLVALGRAHQAASEAPQAASAFEAAQVWRRDRGDILGAAEIAAHLANSLFNAGEFASSVAVLDEARPVLRASTGRGLVDFLGEEALMLRDLGDPKASLASADEAIALAENLGLPPPAKALLARGTARVAIGERAGEIDIRAAVEAAVAAGEMRNALVAHAGLGSALQGGAPVTDAIAAFDEAVAFAAKYGLGTEEPRAARLGALNEAGRYDELFREAPELLAWARARGSGWTAWVTQLFAASAHVARGDGDPLPETLLEDAATGGFPAQGILSLMGVDALLRDDVEAARAFAVRALDAAGEGQLEQPAELVDLAVRVGDLDLARRVVDRTPSDSAVGREIMALAKARLEEAEGAYPAARAAFEELAASFAWRQWPFYHGFALAGAARCAIALGDREQGLRQLRDVRGIAGALSSRTLLIQLEQDSAAAPA